MGSRYRKNGFGNGVVGVVYLIGIYYAVGTALYNVLLKSLLSEQLFWIGFIGLLNPFSIAGVSVYFDKRRAREAEAKRKREVCPHGIVGGQTLSTCLQCKAVAEELQKTVALRRAEADRKAEIGRKSAELRKQEMIRYTEFNLKKKSFLLKISPSQFEDAVSEMYKRLGYEVRQTPYSNDMGKDIILKKDGVKYLAECKRYGPDNTIGREALQKFFAAVIEDGVEKGFFITTSDFKDTAIKYAAKVGKLELINGDQLIALMREAYPENFESNMLRTMCMECGDTVQISLLRTDSQVSCKNGHTVSNDFDQESTLLRYPESHPVCKKCGNKMKLISRFKKKFWGCSGYPKCRSYQKYRARAS